MGRKLKIGLLIDEFFGGAGTAFGGYGFLAREYITKYIPDKNIEMDVLLEMKEGLDEITSEKVDNTLVWRFPREEEVVKKWLAMQNYDLFLSIELTWPSYEILKLVDNKKLILWIQDPRPSELWDEKRASMSIIQDPYVCDPLVSDLVNKMFYQGQIKFVSQGNSLNNRALMLYKLPNETPIQLLPNPLNIDLHYKFDISQKKKQVVFLGRLEAQKRAWIFCEIAKRMPEYEFYVLGKFFRHEVENKKPLEQYMNGSITNLHFMGHLEGEEKKKMLRESRILLNTSIWEGIPISWLECLQYGTLVVSCLDNENIPSRFGAFTGELLGDGYDGIDKFILPIKELMENDEQYTKKAMQAIKYIRKYHTVKKFQNELKRIISKEANSVITQSLKYYFYRIISNIVFGKIKEKMIKKKNKYKIFRTGKRHIDLKHIDLKKHDVCDLSEIDKKKLIDVLKKHYFTSGWVCKDGVDILDSKDKRVDFEDHLFRRLNEFRSTVIPWLDSVCSLRDASILEIGCGTGSSTVALGEKGAKITAIDVAENSIHVAKERCDIYGVQVKFKHLSATDIESLGEQFDIIIFFASMEHMTYNERIQSIRAAYKSAKKNGIIAIVDTPNRLWYTDKHTSRSNFFNWLSDECAVDYAKFTPRESFNTMFKNKNESLTKLARYGRGVSFHEFVIALDGFERLNIVSSMQEFLGFSPHEKYKQFLIENGPIIHDGFYEEALYIALRK